MARNGKALINKKKKKKFNKRYSKKQPPELFFETFIKAHQIGI
jgi:hypothetical protein